MGTVRSRALSIITVCKDRAGDIERTCRSVAGQRWRDFEWIVVDGASKDGTLDILHRYRNRIDVLISEEDGGIFNAMNKGILKARGDRLLFLNGGDELAAPTVLGDIFRTPLPDAEVFFGGQMNVEDDGSEQPMRIPTENGINALFFAHSPIPHQAAFIKRDLFSRFGLYDESYTMLADWEKWIAFAKNGCRFVQVDIFVSRFYMGGVSSSPRFKQVFDEEKKRFCEAHFTNEELAAAKELSRKYRSYRSVKTVGCVAGFCLYRIEEKSGGRKRRYMICGIPVLKKVRVTPSRWRYYLFSCIPFATV